ncbi:MAG: long-chain fatty acid--CoA ligase [Deltaproteobacteria bacterium]|nr:long-chain fatty acid--CoA ligase [Deltaproteobacteria bacterium]
MHINFLLEVFRENIDAEAMVWKNTTVSYAWLLERFDFWCKDLEAKNVKPGTVVVILGDYSPNSIALLLALIQKCCIIIPLTVLNEAKRNEYIEVGMSEACFTMDADDNATFTTFARRAEHEHYACLRDNGHPGLVLFSSGSTGAGKAAVHDFARLLEKYKVRRQNLRTLTFLLYDHIGGVDTMLYSLSNGSCIITVQDRLPDTVCKAIQDHKVDVLPVSPSFLNMLILSEAYARYDLSSLKYITYGAEVMPETTLKKCTELFPGVTLLQKFGTTEVGTLRSKSKSNDSTWVKIGGEGYQIRVVEGILHIKARSAILGYLNAPSPFTDDGWFITNDLVEVDGDYMRILGRKQEVINVGGEKVNPAEVENVIYELENVNEVSIFGEHNAILGNIICAKVSMVDAGQDKKAFISQIKAHCASKLERYKVPVKIEVVDYRLHSDRFKKMRLTLGTNT